MSDTGALLDREAFRRFVNSVGIVAVQDGQRVLALTAEWCTPVSIEPRLVGVYVGVARFTETGLERASAFGLSLLTAAQARLAHELGSVSGHTTDKAPLWAEQRVAGPVLGVPLVRHASAHYECEVVARHDVGDHVLWVGRPVMSRTDHEDDPLCYHGGRYYVLGPNVPKS